MIAPGSGIDHGLIGNQLGWIGASPTAVIEYQYRLLKSEEVHAVAGKANSHSTMRSTRQQSLTGRSPSGDGIARLIGVASPPIPGCSHLP